MSLSAKGDAFAPALEKGLGLEEVQEEQEAAPKPMTLGDLLQDLTAMDRIIDMPDEMFSAEGMTDRLRDDMVRLKELRDNPEAGEELRLRIRQKVDSLQHVISEFEAFEARARMRANRLLSRARTAARRANQIYDYIEQNMGASDLQQLTGFEFVIKRIRSSTPALTREREPGPADMLVFGEEFVEEVPAVYVWKDKALVKSLKPFFAALRDQPECSECGGRGYKVRGSEMAPCLPCIGFGKALPEGIEVPPTIEVASLSYSHRVEFEEADRPDVTPPKKKGKKK